MDLLAPVGSGFVNFYFAGYQDVEVVVMAAFVVKRGVAREGFQLHARLECQLGIHRQCSKIAGVIQNAG